MNIDNLKKRQPYVYQILENSLSKNRLAHAYLFVGERGTAKRDMALVFAMMFVCKSEEKPCLTCSECKRVLAGNHTNVHLIEPDGQNVKKEQIVKLQAEFSKTSLESGARIYVIDHADRMSLGAANSLLKFLEEPLGEKTYGILTTENINGVLPTIMSRCQIVAFKPANKDDLKEKLLSTGLNPKLATIVSELTNNEEQALALCEDDSMLAMIDVVVNIGRIMLEKRESLVLYFKEKQSLFLAKKEDLELFITLLLLYMLDILHATAGDDQFLFDFDAHTIIGLAKQESIEDLRDRIDFLTDTQKKINYNVMTMLVLDQLLIKLERGDSA